MPRADHGETLLNAVERNDEDRLVLLLKTNNIPLSWFTTVNKNNENAFTLALHLGQSRMVKDMIGSGKLPFEVYLQQDKNGDNALMIALKSNDHQTAAAILSATHFPLAALAQRDNKGLTPAQIIAKSRHQGIKSLAEKWPEIHIMHELNEYVNTRSFVAMWQGEHKPFVRKLLKDKELTLPGLQQKMKAYSEVSDIKPNCPLASVMQAMTDYAMTMDSNSEYKKR